MKRSVLIVGRPNVGKSTLFNRLTRSRRALTHDMPGMTRDLIRGIVEDDEITFELVDSGGLEYGDDPLSAFAGEIRQQAEAAIDAADLILLVVDGREGVTAADEEIAQHLRGVADRVIIIANKTDTKAGELGMHEFHSLGFERVLGVSAEHGTGIDELLEAIAESLPDMDGADASVDDHAGPIRLAIIGRPNVGKSSLLNRLLGEERSIVSEISGTTRDSVDTLIERDGKLYEIVDTAGIRRKGKTTEAAEKLSIISARKAIDACDIALVVLDGTEGATSQDATVAGYAQDAGKAAIILVNKWDAVERSEDLAKETEEEIRRIMKFLWFAPIELISAKTGRRVEKIFGVVDRVAASYRARFTTSRVNDILERAVQRHMPPAISRGRARRFYYGTQVKDSPPTFALFSNTSEPIHFSYRRYLENTFREELGLFGTPVRLVIRSRKGFEGRGSGGRGRV